MYLAWNAAQVAMPSAASRALSRLRAGGLDVAVPTCSTQAEMGRPAAEPRCRQRMQCAGSSGQGLSIVPRQLSWRRSGEELTWYIRLPSSRAPRTFLHRKVWTLVAMLSVRELFCSASLCTRHGTQRREAGV